jgi:hypothetical protein
MSRSPRAFSGRFLAFAVSLGMVGVLIMVFLPKIDREMDSLEQKRFDYRLAEIKTAVQFMQLELQVKSSLASAKELRGANPMRWLKGRVEETPPQYLGERPIDLLNDQPGNWIYDPKLRVLAYLPSSSIVYEGRLIERDELLFFRVETIEEGSKVQALSLEYIAH